MDNTTKLRLSKVSIIIFTVVQIFCGIHFGFVKMFPTKWRVFLKFLSVVCSCCMLSMLFIRKVKETEYQCMYALYSAEYISFALILFLSKNTFFDFLLHYSKVDCSLSMPENSLEASVVMAVVLPILSVIFKVLTHNGYCYFNSDLEYCIASNVEFLAICFNVISLDAMVLIQFVITYTCYGRVNALKCKFADKELPIISTVLIYKDIFDGFDNIKPTMDKMILASIFYCIPKHMIIIYIALHNLKASNDWATFILQYIILLQISLMSLLPAIIAEMVNSKVDAIKLTLNNYFLGETDKQRRSELKTALRYLKGRPSQYYVWRRIPVDLRMLACGIGIVTSYLIVVIQYTHLYD